MARCIQIDASTTTARIVPPDTLYPHATPLVRATHIALTIHLADLIERHVIDDAARLAFVLTMMHPDFGEDAQRAYAEAVASFNAVVVTVAISDIGFGASIGQERMDLHGRSRGSN